MSSDNRVFEIFLRMQNGEEFTREQLESEYKMSRRTIYQDLQEIRETLSEVTHSGQELIKIADGKYKLSKANTLDERHIYALSKILLESRAFNKNETRDILDELLSAEAPKTKNWLHHSILDELENYHSITNDSDRLDLLYELETVIQENLGIQFNYRAEDEMGFLGPDNMDKTVKLRPLGVFFDNFYFYLAGLDKDEKYQIFHVKDISQLKSFPIERTKKAKEAWDIEKIRYQTNYAYAYGEDIQVKFEYYAYIDYVLDKFPEAHIRKLDKPNPMKDLPWYCHFPVYEVEISVNFNIGTIMWFLSSIPRLKVLSPQILVDEIGLHAQIGLKTHPISQEAENTTGHDLSALFDRYSN